MYRFLNLTPHEIVIRLPDGRDWVLHPAGQVARIETLVEESWLELEDGTTIPLRRTRYGQIHLPDPEPGTIYVVSTLVAAAAKRRDVVSPDTNNAVRDSQGRISAVTGFQSFAEE